MSKFDYYIDQKVTVWRRNFYSIEADTKEDANEKAKAVFSSKESEFEELTGFKTSELVFETEADLSPAENNTHSTRELYEEEFSELLAENGIAGRY